MECKRSLGLLYFSWRVLGVYWEHRSKQTLRNWMGCGLSWKHRTPTRSRWNLMGLLDCLNPPKKRDRVRGWKEWPSCWLIHPSRSLWQQAMSLCDQVLVESLQSPLLHSVFDHVELLLLLLKHRRMCHQLVSFTVDLWEVVGLCWSGVVETRLRAKKTLRSSPTASKTSVVQATTRSSRRAVKQPPAVASKKVTSPPVNKSTTTKARKPKTQSETVKSTSSKTPTTRARKAPGKSTLAIGAF